jgi:hypothetical protein
MRGMETVRFPLALVAAVGAVLAFTVVPASADGNGATLTKDFRCFILVAPIVAVTTDQSIDFGTSGGNTNLICHFRADDFIGPLPTETVHLTEIPCTTFEGRGTGNGTFTKSGNGVFKCTRKAT